MLFAKPNVESKHGKIKWVPTTMHHIAETHEECTFLITSVIFL